MKQMIKWSVFGLFLVVLQPLAQAQITPAEIYRKTSPSVVLLISRHPQSSSRFKGTGSIIGRGLVLTNAHVVLDEQERPYGRISAFLPSDNPNDHNQKFHKNGHLAHQSGGLFWVLRGSA